MIASTVARARTKLAALATDEVMSKLARGGLAALIIKIGAAGLSLLMFLMLARAMSVEEYGRFGFAFSLATLLAVAGSFGFRALVLRFAPAYNADSATELERGIIRYGYGVTALGCGFLGLAVITIALFFPGLDNPSYLIVAAFLTVALGLAEYQACVMRAITRVTLALVPRDILWRVAVVIACGLVVTGIVPSLTATSGAAMVTTLLLVIVLGQALAHPMTRPASLLVAPARFEPSKWWRSAWGLWGTLFVREAAPNLSVVLIGLLMSPAATGPFFAALRLAIAMNLFLMASGMVVAPAIARHFHRNEIDIVRRLCLMTVAGVAIPTLAMFMVFVLYGREIIGLFGSGFESAYIALLVLSAGNLVNALSGPTIQIMEMTGAERPYFRIVLVTNLIALLLMVALTPLFGIVGAAIAVAFGTSAWNVRCILYIRKTLVIDPSILAAFKRRI